MTYILIIALASVIILSFFFNIIAEKTNIPSVLMLIGLGMGTKAILNANGHSLDEINLDTMLQILGNIGLVMIVLEAALDLKLERDKIGLIVRSMVTAIIGIGGCMFGLAAFFMYIFPSVDLYTALLNATPLSIMSSAIVIPSVGRIRGDKKEFMVYESTFSDIIGIMVFYFMIGADGGAGGGSLTLEIVLNVLGTLVLSLLLAYVMVYLFQHLKMQVKLFLVLAILILLFAIGKVFHLSSLLIILTFGLVLNNSELFFRGRLKKLFNREQVQPIIHDFHNLTLEFAFLLRTFFFVVFGLSITVTSLYNIEVAVNSLVIVLILYAVRYISLRVFAKEHIKPELWIAPRGLITVLLYFVLMKSDAHLIENFDTGLLLYPILITSIVMMIGLISYRGEKVTDVIFRKSSTISDEEFDLRAQENTEKQDMDGF